MCAPRRTGGGATAPLPTDAWRGLSGSGGVTVDTTPQSAWNVGETLIGGYGDVGDSAGFMSSSEEVSPQPTRTQPGSAQPTGPHARVGTARASSSRSSMS